MVNWYDVLIIDCGWFCRSKRFRIPDTEDIEKDDLDYMFHIKCGFKGQFIGLPVVFPTIKRALKSADLRALWCG